MPSGRAWLMTGGWQFEAGQIEKQTTLLVNKGRVRQKNHPSICANLNLKTNTIHKLVFNYLIKIIIMIWLMKC
ncbi:hypothetical protein CUU66_20420 [Peribacillus deserti]|uniref:Uncharacterized protein n=1 Tax=Peribacillus deserti TaxID=673318 RepID=A0A2N5M160_9BACI|nr:hypothetical protein CUU66_20420 [Peribacillus deserti]